MITELTISAAAMVLGMGMVRPNRGQLKEIKVAPTIFATAVRATVLRERETER